MPGLFGVLAKKESAAGTRVQTMAQRMALSLRRLPWLRVNLQLSHEFCAAMYSWTSRHLQTRSPSQQA
jgi:hypothetical protein